MSHNQVYQEIVQYLDERLGEQLGHWSRKRLALLVTGVIQGQSGAPSRMAQALSGLGVEPAQVESIERRIRRSENDEAICAERCYAPVVRHLLQHSRLEQLLLLVDMTTQAEHVVLLSVNAWYRGRSLPLGWRIWPGQVPLEGAGIWERVGELLQAVAILLPPGIRVTVLADRAFGTPAFTDQVEALGWNWLVRLHHRTICRDQCGKRYAVGSLVRKPGQRRKLSGTLFRGAGWRSGSVVVFWGARHRSPLCLGSNLPPGWELIALYRRRYPIEATFRDYKSYGWHWEQGQVRSLAHVERLLVAMALATCLILLLGAALASQLLATPPSGRRRSRPWYAKRSLFRLGLLHWHDWLAGRLAALPTLLPDWTAPNWSTQLYAHHARAFVFALPVRP